MRRATLLVVLALGVLAGASVPGVSTAQDAGSGLFVNLPPEVAVSFVTAGEAPVLPSAPARLRLDHLTMEPDASWQHQAPGPVLLAVDRGAVAVTDDLGIEGVLPTGAAVVLLPGALYTLRGSGSESAVAYQLSVGSTSEEPSPIVADGLAVDAVLDWELAALPPTPATLFVARLTLAAGADTERRAAAGPTALLVEEGVVALAGASVVSDTLASGQSALLEPGVPFRLQSGAAGATVLMAGVAPAGQPATTPVTPTPAPTATTMPPTSTPPPTNTPVPPTPTPAPPPPTPAPPPPTPAPPTSTPVPTNTPAPTNTPIPTHTPIPPTSTSEPTNTPLPTSTPVPTNTPIPPTDTPVPTPTVEIRLSLQELLPAASGVPGMDLVEEGGRTDDAIIDTFPDPEDAARRFAEWGWEENAFRLFLPPGEIVPANTASLDVSLHQFATPEGAAAALPYFADARAVLVGLQPVYVDRIGDQSWAIAGPVANGYEVTLYVRRENVLARITAFSVAGDPTAAAQAAARAFVSG